MTSTRPTAGGPANNKGVLYQMLWTLFRATELAGEIQDPERDETGTLVGATLVLEPVQDIAAGKRRGEQKEEGSSDSLQQEEESSDSLWEEIQAVEVLADLGQWREVIEGVVRLGGYFSYEFFQSPARPVLSDEDLQPALEALEGNFPPPEGAVLA